MPIPLINRQTGEVFDAKDDQEAQAQIKAYGLEPASPDDVAAYENDQKYGSTGNALRTVPGAALASAAQSFAGATETAGKAIEGLTGFGRAPEGLTERESPPVTGATLAPSAFTPEQKGLRQANPKAAFLGAVAPDIAAGFAVPGEGLAGLAGRAVTAGITGEGAASVLEDRPFTTEGAATGGLIAGVLEGAGHVVVNQAMRYIGKRAQTAVDASVDRVRRAAVRDLQNEADPVLKAQQQVEHAPAAFEEYQAELNEAIDVIDERLGSSPDKLFSPRMLASTVSENPSAQAEAVAGLAQQFDHVAQVTGHIASNEASAILSDAAGGSGADLFDAMRRARAALDNAAEASPLFEAAPSSPLFSDANKALDVSLEDQALWGTAAKNQADYRAYTSGETPAIRVEDLSQREALDQRLDLARRAASATGDKKLSAAVKRARGAIGKTDDVLGAQLGRQVFGPKPTVLQQAAGAALDIGEERANSLLRSSLEAGGATVGAHIAGPAGGVAGFLAGRRLHTALGERWTKRIFDWARGAVKRNPTKIAGAGLLAASGLEDDRDNSMLAANAGLLVFFLPSGGRAHLAEQLGEHLAALTSRERLAVRNTTMTTAKRTEELLYRLARGEREIAVPEISATVSTPQGVQDLQHTLQLHEYAKRAGLGEWSPTHDPTDEIPDVVQKALLADLKTRNAALVENDHFLLRQATPGRLDLEQGEGRSGHDISQLQLRETSGALQEGDMPQWAARMLGERQRLLGTIMGRSGRDDIERMLAEQLESLRSGAKRGMGRLLNAREDAYAEAALRNVVEARVEDNADYARANMRAGTQLLDARRQRLESPEPPAHLQERTRASLGDARRRLNDSIDAARRGDVPSQNILEQNPRKYYEGWLQDAVTRGQPFDDEAKAWAKAHLLDPVYEYLGREPTAGEGLPRVVRELANVSENPPANRAQYFETWQADAELRLDRKLTPEEIAWGRDQILRPQLRAISGEGQRAQGAGPEFRRLGLPEPQQGDVRIESPMQQKAFPFKAELPQTARIEGEPMRAPGDPLFERRAARAHERLQSQPDIEQAFPVEAQTEYRRYQRSVQQGDYRLHEDDHIERMARGRAEEISRHNAEAAGQPLSPDVQEFIQAHLERDMRQRRALQLREQPLNAEERAQHAFNALAEGDMSDRLHSLHSNVREAVANQIRHDSSPAEIQGHIRRGLEEMKDRFIVEQNRPPNARERAYLEADLANEAGNRVEIEQREQQVQERRAREQAEREERARQEQLAREQATQRESQRVEDLMGAFDLPEERQEAIARRYDQVIGDLLEQKGEPRDGGRAARGRVGVDNYHVIEALKAQPDGLSPQEEVFVLDQLNEPAPAVNAWMRDAVDEIARNDESHWSDHHIPDLEFDDVVRAIERGATDDRGRGALDPWEEYHVREQWDEDASSYESQHREYIEERRGRDKQEYEDEQEAKREREAEEEEEYGSGGSSGYDDAVGLPDASELRSIGLDNVEVQDPHGIERVIGRDLSLRDVEDLCALEPLNEVGASTKLIIGRGAIEFEARGGGVTLDRTYSREGGDLVVKHDQFFLEGSEQGQGFMKKVFQKMMPAYERLGFKKAAVGCAAIGRYLWPSLGFRATPEIEASAIQAFRGWIHDTMDLGLPTSEIERLGESLKTLRDVADATVPKHIIEHRMERLKEAYESSIARLSDEKFARFFLTKDGDFKLGKAFLITRRGPWNEYLSLRIDPSDPWYREARRRVGLMSITGLGLFELSQALSDDPMTLSRREGQGDEAAPQAQLTPSAEEHAANGATRQKLAYLESQSQALTRTTARSMVTPAQAERRVPALVGITQSTGVQSFLGNQASLRSAFDEKKDLLRRLAQDPQSLVEEMTHSLGDVSDAAPELHRQLVAKTYEVLQFVQSKIPGTIGSSLTRPDGTPPSDTALRQFALYYSAATHPGTVLADLANNRARREQVDTLHALWPEQYQKVKDGILAQLADHRPSLNQRTRLDLLFDFGESLDRALSPRIVQARAEYLAQSDPAKAQKGAPERRTQPSIVGTSPTARLSYGGTAAA